MDKSELKLRLIERLADSSTALVCNAYDFMGIHAPSCDWNIKCLTPEFPPMVGEAITITLDCSTPDDEISYEMERGDHPPEDGNLYYKLVELVEAASVPQVVIIQSAGNYALGAVLGDGMAKTFLAAGAVGVVTNGAVRDIADVKRAGLMTFGGGLTVNHYSLRWSGLQKPVTVGGLTINTGDLVHGDQDGLITLPEQGWPKIVRACRHVLDFEKEAHVVLRMTEIGAMEKSRRVGDIAARYGKLIGEIESFEQV